MPFNTCLEYKVPPTDAAVVWQSFGEGGAFTTREGGKPFLFAAPTAEPPTLKVDAELLDDHQEVVDRLLGLYALHPCVVEADALSFVPNGMAKFANRLGRRIGKPVINLIRPKGAARSDIRFVSPADEDLARTVNRVCAAEDISRTGFSAYVTAQTLREVNSDLDVHTLSMLQRDAVDPAYTTGPSGVAYHTFVRQDIPLTVEAFHEQFPGIPVVTVA